MLAAAVPGLLLGGMFVAVPDLGTPCTNLEDGASGPSVTREGSLGATGSVDLALSCGELDLVTVPGSGWRLVARDGSGRETTTSDAGDRLVADADTRHRRFGWDTGAVDWDVALPTGPVIDLDVALNAGRGRIDLDGARLEGLAVDVNAGKLRLDLEGALVPRLDLQLNAAAATVILPATGDVTGDLDLNAGSLELCAPDDLGLRVRGETTLGSTDFNGLLRRDDAWETPNYTSAPFQADLTVTASVGSVTINPEGGCK